MTAPAHTILVIDDDPLHLQLYSWMMKKEGYHAVTALVGSNSVDFPEGHPIDVVLLDYRLNSSLTAREIANLVNEKFRGVPIIVLSELPWPPDDIREFAATFVSKDEPATLMKSIASLISAHSEAERDS
jgi:CheY-like chemotaxis protein